MTNPDYADKIAEGIVDYWGEGAYVNDELTMLIVDGVRKGYEIGYATAIDMNVVKRGGW